MKVAVIGTNSFFHCGESAFLWHLTYNSGWDTFLFSETGEFREVDDIPLRNDMKLLSDSEVDVLEDYDAIIIATLRWGGNYKFLERFKNKKIGIIMWDVNSFPRMGVQELLSMFPRAIKFVFGEYMKFRSGKKAVMIPLAFNPDSLPEPIYGKEKDRLVCLSRFSPTKHPDFVAHVVGDYPIHFYGVDTRTFPIVDNVQLDVFDKSTVYLHRKAYSYMDLPKMLSSARAVVDGVIWIHPYVETYYTALESWNYGMFPMVWSGVFSDNLIPEITCLELTQENVKRVFGDNRVIEVLNKNGREMIFPKHDASDTRKRILEALC